MVKEIRLGIKNPSFGGYLTGRMPKGIWIAKAITPVVGFLFAYFMGFISKKQKKIIMKMGDFFDGPAMISGGIPILIF